MKEMQTMDAHQRLEEISEKIRMGEPVGIFEAIEAIEYQEALKEERKQKKFFARLRKWLST